MFFFFFNYNLFKKFNFKFKLKIVILQESAKLAEEQLKKGIFKIDEKQSKFPVKFMQKMLKDYKTPRKVDNGPDLPPY